MAKSPSADQVSESVAATAPVDNVLLAEWSGPFGGVPAFDAMDIAALKPALEFGMAENLAEIDKIANNPEAPTFANTIAEMERSGKSLSRVFTYWGIWSGNMSSPEFRAVQAEMAPKLAAFSSKIIQNDKLFQRVKAVYDARNDADLTAEQIRVVELTYDEFATNGATLSGEAKERYAAINNRLAELHTSFANNVLADEEGYDLFLSEDQLAGLPESFVNAAAALATEKGQSGKYAITNTRSSMDPFLTYSTNRELREKVWNNYYSRGDNGDEHDNNAIIAEILQLRDERVALLGFDNYAAWRLQNRMAKTPQRAIALMEAVWPAAVARVHEEVADMQAVANAENADIKIAPWDYRFYAEKVRKAKYDLNSDEVKQYLQLDNLREGMFYVAGELFNFTFTPVKEGSVAVFHEDVKVWEVTDKTSGEHIGLWYLDPFARSGKRSGAWASMYRDHTTFDGKETVLASNNSNFIKGAPGEPVLVSWDDAETFFHEFGHALHFLASNVSYPTLNGGVRDYTEFQSQLLERWLSTDPIIDNYLVHYKTGESIPADLVAKIKQAATFNQGFATTEYLASALVDIKLHTTDPTGIDPDKFERETLNALGMPSELVMRHRTPHFGHIFSGEGYSAGYYGYMWADVLTSDASEAFAEADGGFYDKEVAAKLVKYLFAPRNAIDPAEAYRLFRGRDAGIEPLMRDRGFPLPGEKSEGTAAAGE
ncbi:M3 family metallopeptidase [Microbulbifer agarilyticus]|uniref:M3 family metallopeptidase n=1 Tax=Microbulbifer agarilyticus TaxID=260552 RepID=UPI001C952F45|nr:M3 family metallopeptidase [Microbulbifer agarilyticus]MBY6210799.1 M3 family metallopeptidase [Microbulbifer agarilyticus]MCA0892018.1 M3 family metallopeptidase [Microbulbifer agarilyticus]